MTGAGSEVTDTPIEVCLIFVSYVYHFAFLHFISPFRVTDIAPFIFYYVYYPSSYVPTPLSRFYPPTENISIYDRGQSTSSSAVVLPRYAISSSTNTPNTSPPVPPLRIYTLCTQNVPHGSPSQHGQPHSHSPSSLQKECEETHETKEKDGM